MAALRYLLVKTRKGGNKIPNSHHAADLWPPPLSFPSPLVRRGMVAHSEAGGEFGLRPDLARRAEESKHQGGIGGLRPSCEEDYCPSSADEQVSAELVAALELQDQVTGKPPFVSSTSTANQSIAARAGRVPARWNIRVSPATGSLSPHDPSPRTDEAMVVDALVMWQQLFALPLLREKHASTHSSTGACYDRGNTL